MKKIWSNAEIEMVELKDTAFGLIDPDKPDSDKTQVEIDGKWGYQQLYGEGELS